MRRRIHSLDRRFLSGPLESSILTGVSESLAAELRLPNLLTLVKLTLLEMSRQVLKND